MGVLVRWCPITIPMEAQSRGLGLHGRDVLNSHHHHHRSSFSCFVSLNRFGNVLTFAICIGNRNGNRHASYPTITPRATASMSMVKAQDKSSSSSTIAMRKIVWTIETQVEVEEDQLVYITGDPTQLGCWEPHMAIPMSPPTQTHPNLWTAKTQLHIASSGGGGGGCFKYNYFIKDNKRHDAICWRPGPEFSLSVPLPDSTQTAIVVRDSWLTSAAKCDHRYSFFQEDPYLQTKEEQPPFISIPIHQSDGQIETENHLRTEPLHHVKPRPKDRLCSNNASSDTFPTQSYQPVEEPWLLQSPSFSTESEEDDVGPIDDEEKFEDIKNLPQQGDDSVSTLILINSSLCTMQRIAVLEDGHLVELLLEPVKTNVQCDSVYLGVVTKLVPHMGGAFVNIGNSRPSLMDIKQNREPFIFPPFQKGVMRPEVNGALVEAIEEHLASLGNNHTAIDSEITDEMSGVVDEEGNDTEDELDDASEIFSRDVNGSIVDHGETEADYEETAMAFSGYSQMPNLQDIRDSGHTVSVKNKWGQVQKGTKIIVQVVKEGLGTKGPTLTAYPKLRSRFWVMITRCDRIGVSKKISGLERTRLKVIAKTLQPHGFGLTVRTVAAGHTLEELQKDLEGLLSTWKNITEQAKSASLAADEGVEGAVPVILHEAMAQTLSVVQDYFNEKVERMVVDSARTFHEVTNYLQDIAPDLCGRVELFRKRIPLFDEFNVEEEINNILSKRVTLANGGSLVIEQTEALVSIDVNGGHVMFGHGNSQEKAVLDVNLAAAKQIARELRLRDIGGIIVVDFIDMMDESNKRLVYEEVKKAVERDRSMVKVSELSKHGLMEITRKRVRPSVTFMISEPCSCCHATGRVEALETSFSKIEQEISRLLATMYQKPVPGNPKLWPKFVLRVDHHMCEYLTSGKRTRLALLSSSLKVWILLKVARGFIRGAFEVKPFAEDKESSENRHQVTIPVLRQTEPKIGHPAKKVTLIPVKKWKTGGRK